MRRPEEVLVVVHRDGRTGPEFLVLQRSPERQGYWHVIAGALEPGESAVSAAARELREETGLDATVQALGREYAYSLADEPPEVRARFASDVTEIAVTPFVAQAPRGWEPSLDDEHVDHRWCSAADAARLLRYPEPMDAMLEADRMLRKARA